MHHYIAYGLHIVSEISLPELREHHDATQVIDVSIKKGDTPKELSNPKETSARWQAKTNELLLRVDNVASYWVTDGKMIIVQTHDDADNASIRLFLLGSAMGAILLQRNYLPLHANCVVYKEQAFAFSGRSGIGKSTLAAALMQKGFEILTDDVCAIDFSTGTPKVYSAGANIKLWQHAIERLDYSNDALPAVRPDMQKYLYPIDSLDPSKSYPLQQIYFLRHHNLSDTNIVAVDAKSAISLIKKNTYREMFAQGLGLQASNFKQHLQLASYSKVLQVTRPKIGFALDDLVQAVTESIENHVKP